MDGPTTKATATNDDSNNDGGMAANSRRHAPAGPRGPFLPRPDLENHPPPVDDDDDDRSNHSKAGSAASSGGKGRSQRRPPQPPPNGKKKRHLPVTSSGYGRPSSSPFLALERRHSSSGSRAMWPPSPARSVAGSPGLRGTRSGARSSSTARLRHGDGTLPGTIGSILAGNVGLKSSATRGRARTPSPAPKLGRRRRSASVGGSVSSVGHDGARKSGRARTPGPAGGKRARRASSGGGMGGSGGGCQGGSAPKRPRDGRNATTNTASATKPPPPSANAPDYTPASPPRTTTVSSPSRRDYTAVDADPTPVREARRLSLDFRNRTDLPPPPMMTLEEEGGGSVAGKDEDEEKEETACLAANGDGSSPVSATKPFQPPNPDNANSITEQSPFGGVDPSVSETSLLASAIFARHAGIDAPTLHRLLAHSKQGRGDVKQWELRKRVEHMEEETAVLRIALRDLREGKDQFVAGAAEVERKLRTTMGRAKRAFEGLTEENAALAEELQGAQDEKAAWKEEAHALQREKDAVAIQCERLRAEAEAAKDEWERERTAGTDHAVAMAVLESRLEESVARREEVEARAVAAEAAKDEAVKEAEARVTGEMGGELATWKAKHEALTATVEALRARKEEVCRIMGVDLASVDFASEDGAASDDSFVRLIQGRVEGYQQDVQAKERLEQECEARRAELEKARADHQSSQEALAAKDRDLRELTKGIGDVQRAGEDHRRAAEERAVAAEGQVVEHRERAAAVSSEKKALEEALSASRAACASHESTLASLQKEMADAKISTVQHDAQLQLERDLRAKAEEKESEERSERIALAAQLHAQVRERAQKEKALQEAMEAAERDFAAHLQRKEDEAKAREGEVAQCRETIAALEARQRSLTASLSDQKSMLDASREEEIGGLRSEIATLEARLTSEVERSQAAGAASEARVRELEEMVRKGQAERKRMHSIIQELRGNVRVFARIRPFIPDDSESETSCVLHESDAIVSVSKQSDPSQRHRFTFDRVFAPSSGQETVFEEVSEFVQSALDGYNVCLFSYGQTGSGKTHTMQGSGDGVMRGLIPRSIEQIARHKAQMEIDGWTFSMEVSFLEIYNETIRDLLRVNPKEEHKHDIKVGSDGRRTVTNLTIKPIDPGNNKDVESVLTLATKRRSTASTDMNSTSSRSHSVFTLNMMAKHEERNQIVRGTLNLVDLAGSERLDRSNVAGQQAKEAVSINKSLSSLADVFTAIGQKQNHVPFRNSKLTYLLQPALSGDGKTLMFVNLSPTKASVQESLCSLRFASKVNKCELGKAKRTVEEATAKASSKRGATSSKGSTVGRNVKRKM